MSTNTTFDRTTVDRPTVSSDYYDSNVCVSRFISIIIVFIISIINRKVWTQSANAISAVVPVRFHSIESSDMAVYFPCCLVRLLNANNGTTTKTIEHEARERGLEWARWKRLSGLSWYTETQMNSFRLWWRLIQQLSGVCPWCVQLNLFWLSTFWCWGSET